MTRRLLILIAICLILSPCLAQQQPWCGITVLYFQHNPTTTPAGYEELINYPSGNAEVDENVTILNTDGWVLIDSYITPEGALDNTQEDLAGLRRYRFYSYVSSNVGTTQLNFTPFRRFPNGTEVKFYSAESEDINSLTVDEYLLSHVSQTTLELSPGDRIVIKVYAKTTHSSPITVHWVYQGSVHTSRVESGYFVCEENQMAAAGSTVNELPLPLAIPLLALIGVIALWSIRKR